MVTLTTTEASGISVVFGNNPVNLLLGTQSSVYMTLVVSANVAPGSYTVNVSGVSGSVSESASFRINVVQYLVIAENNSFNPSNLTVKAGSAVYWINLDTPGGGDQEVHDVVFKTGNIPTSPDLQPSPTYGTFSYTFTTPGAYQYFCQYHAPYMTGEIVVTS